LCGFFNHPDIDDHVVSKILVSGDEGISLLVLERDAFGPARTGIKTIEVLNSCYNRVSCIVREDLHPHREARSILG
jgi:hypothetical protein